MSQARADVITKSLTARGTAPANFAEMNQAYDEGYDNGRTGGNPADGVRLWRKGSEQYDAWRRGRAAGVKRYGMADCMEAAKRLDAKADAAGGDARRWKYLQLSKEQFDKLSVGGEHRDSQGRAWEIIKKNGRIAGRNEGSKYLVTVAPTFRGDAAAWGTGTVEALVKSLYRTGAALENNARRGATVNNKDIQRMIDNYNRYKRELLSSDRQVWKNYCSDRGWDPGHDGYDFMA